MKTSDHASVICDECRRLLQQITQTRHHERREMIRLILALRIIPVNDGQDILINATLENVARTIADVRQT